MSNDLTLAVLSAQGDVKYSAADEGELVAVYEGDFVSGDTIRVTAPSAESFLIVQLDPTLDPTLVYLESGTMTYQVPVSEDLLISYAPGAFIGGIHCMTARVACGDEITRYRNLACNPHDLHDADGVFPHARANVETRNEPAFFARNVIDGIAASTSHGHYPFQSWGVGDIDDPVLRVEFGRPVAIDRIGVVLRADFPHDTYWKNVTFTCSDGFSQSVALVKTGREQVFPVGLHTVSWVEIHDLVKANNEGEGEFASLTQLSVYGRYALSAAAEQQD